MDLVPTFWKTIQLLKEYVFYLSLRYNDVSDYTLYCLQKCLYCYTIYHQQYFLIVLRDI